jgi:hypothetical protein
MPDSNGLNERLILDTLKMQPSMTMEHLVTLLPQMTWNCIFQVIDALSRGGKIRIQRRGFDYELGLAADTSDSSWPNYVESLSGSGRRRGHLPKHSVLTHGGK